MAKAPEPGSIRHAKPDPPYTIIVDKVEYPLHFNDASARDDNDLSKSYADGGLNALVENVSKGMGLKEVAALVWLSRRQNGEPGLPFDAVLDSVSFASKFQVKVSDPGEGDSPEA